MWPGDLKKYRAVNAAAAGGSVSPALKDSMKISEINWGQSSTDFLDD